MLLNILQMGMDIPPGILITYLILVGIGFLASVLFLKLGLIAVKAERNRSFKWLSLSFFIQVLVIFMIGSPFILLGIAEVYNGGPSPGLIIFVIVIVIFIDMNVINVIHRTGLLKSIWPFILMAIPIAATVGLGFMVSRLGLFIQF